MPIDPGVPPALAALLAEISSGGIRFEVDGADLDDGARRLLDGVALLVADRDDLLVVVRGHTDSTGGPEINDPLSVRRAQVVADYLVAHGVPGGRIQVIGLGADAPAADNATIEGRRANRRSEITTVERD
jgi:adhesin transport system outer membrane protein